MASEPNWTSGAPAEAFLRTVESTVLDPFYKTLPLWQDDDCSASYALLAQHDSLFAVDFAIANSHAGPPEELNLGEVQVLKGREEGLSQALRWFAERVSGRAPTPKSDWHLIDRAGAFVSHAAQYVDIADTHKAFGRGLCSVVADPGLRRIRFEYNRFPGNYSPLAGIFESSRFDLRHARAAMGAQGMHARIESARTLDRTPHSLRDGRIVIAAPAGLLQSGGAEKAGPLLHRDLPELADSFALSGFTLGDFDRFWEGLVTWSVASIILYSRYLIMRTPQETCLPTQVVARSLFVEALSRGTSLSRSVIDAIVNCLTFDRRSTSPDVFQQPLLGDGQTIAWSVRVALFSNSRRNLIKLLARTGHSDEMANLVGVLANSASGKLIQRLQKAGYICKKNQHLSSPSSAGETDLVCWHRDAPSEVLVIEVKGCLPADEVNEIASLTATAIEGQEQLQRQIQLLSSLDRPTLATKFAFVDWESVKSFYGIVVLYKGSPNNTFDHSRFPCVGVQTLVEGVRASEFHSPRQIWDACRTKRWLASLDTGTQSWRSLSIGDVVYELPVVMH